MAAVAIDSLEYAHQLEAVGMPREQAEAVAKGLTNMFIHNFESLVTRDYLDTRFSEFETGINANMDKRFTQVDKRFTELENSLTEMRSATDMRFVTLENKVDRRFDALEIRFESIDGKFSRIHLMFGLTMATATIPILQNLFG